MKMLIAEDNRLWRTLLERLLGEWGYEVVVAQNGGEAWEMLRTQDDLRLAILDWMMPDLDGVEVCRRVRDDIRGRYVYLIILTARNATEDMVKAIEAGADDFIAKPFDAAELRVRLRAGLRILELNESLRYQAYHDPLTGVWNRTVLDETLAMELARSLREQIGLGLVLADIDHFKRINDTHGHPVGDEVLKQVAHRLRSTLRAYDALGRYGGEEFLIIIPGGQPHAVHEIAERLRQAIAATPFETAHGPVPVTLSLGAIHTRPWPELTAKALIDAVDAELYRAKHGGRNRVEYRTLTAP